jgi:hypothetical protein
MDPLSPLLFNYVVESLSTILSTAYAAGHIQVVARHLICHTPLPPVRIGA